MQVALRVKVHKDIDSDIDSLYQGALGEHVVYRGISGRAGEVLAGNDGAGGAGGPRKGVVGRVGGVCGVWCRRIVATEPKEGERGGAFDGRTRERTGNWFRRPNA